MGILNRRKLSLRMTRLDEMRWDEGWLLKFKFLESCLNLWTTTTTTYLTSNKKLLNDDKLFRHERRALSDFIVVIENLLAINDSHSYETFFAGFEWVGWSNDSVGAPGKPVELTFQFDSVRNFSAMVLHTNNMFTKGVQVSRLPTYYTSMTRLLN